jgi:hypothetical protein
VKNLAPKWRTWLRDCLRDPGTHFRVPAGLTLGALTGQDDRTLDAIAACWMLYAGSDDDGAQAALSAVRCLLPALQPQCRPFARELIAWALDWPDRDRLWPLVQP